MTLSHPRSVQRAPRKDGAALDANRLVYAEGFGDQERAASSRCPNRVREASTGCSKFGFSGAQAGDLTDHYWGSTCKHRFRYVDMEFRAHCLGMPTPMLSQSSLCCRLPALLLLIGNEAVLAPEGMGCTSG